MDTLKEFWELVKEIFKEFSWFFNILIAIGVIWFITGGRYNESARQPFIDPSSAQIGSSKTIGEVYKPKLEKPKKSELVEPRNPVEIFNDTKNTISDLLGKDSLVSADSIDEESSIRQFHMTSILSKSIFFDGKAGAENSDANREFIRILTGDSIKDEINLSKLKLNSVLNKEIEIPQGENMPILGTPYIKKDIKLGRNSRAIISSGRSPIGISFKVNICSAYLNQYQEFVPELKKDCPLPIDEFEKYGPYNDSSCKVYVMELDRCHSPKEIPANLSRACKDFVQERLNYNGCVIANQHEKDFYKNEWRIFLEKNKELWRNKNELIQLIDQNQKLIDIITY